MLLAAGFGTRLGVLSELRAKALIPMGDAPLLVHLVERLRRAGAGPMVINAHHRADQVRGYAKLLGLEVSEEPSILGTAGGLHKAGAFLGPGDVLVWNGDILADLDASALVQAHGEGLATLAVSATEGQGNVGLDGAGRIVRLRGETVAAGETWRANFLGVHVVGGWLRGRLPETGCLVGDVYLPVLRAGGVLCGYDYRGAWWDLGTAATYLEANLAWLKARGLEAWVAADARVGDGVRLKGAVVGAGAVVNADLDRVVVWPGVRVNEALCGAIAAGVTVRVG
jgi:mannose-1-phosphate guanylyltransferase